MSQERLRAFVFSSLIFTMVFWMITIPVFLNERHPKFSVDDISLTRFTLSPITNLSVANMTFINPPNTLSYNLAVNMTFRNPNRYIGVHFDKMDAYAIYQGHQFGPTERMQGIYLGYKTENNNVGIVFEGQQLVLFSDADKVEHDRETKDDHVYRIHLRLRFKMKYIYVFTKEHYHGYEIGCDLKAPLSMVSSAKFDRTKCEFIPKYESKG